MTIGIGILGGGIIGSAYIFLTRDLAKAEYKIDIDANKLEAQFKSKSNKDQSSSNHNQQSDNKSSQGSNNPNDPDDDDDEETSRKKGDPYTTNKQDQKDAEELGYKRDKNPPFNPQDKHAFRKGQTWITGDRTGHKDGRWKMMNNKGGRIGTFDKDLKKIIGN